jgi:NAD-dependent SIR2 family protein deacetylase
LLITAGAGMGIDSGLPDFRGINGFWAKYPALLKLGINFEEMASPHWFIDNPHLAWGFYSHRWMLYKKTQPHEGFAILLNLVSTKRSFFVFTSNVDGHFQKAGFHENHILECHGSINHLQCFNNCGQALWSLPEDYKFSIDQDTLLAKDPLPYCPSCRGIARPNILMFSDASWDFVRGDEQKSNFTEWQNGNKFRSLTIIEIGAGIDVPTVRMTSESLYRDWDKNVTFIRINPQDFDSPPGTYVIKMSALQALRQFGKKK